MGINGAMYLHRYVIHIAVGQDLDHWIASSGEGEDRVTGSGWNPEDALAEMMQKAKARQAVILLDKPKLLKSKLRQMKTAEREMKLDELRRAYASVDKLSEELGLIPRGSYDSVQGIRFVPEYGPSQKALMVVVIPDGTGKWDLISLAQADDGTFQLDQLSPGYESIDTIRQDLGEWLGA